MKKYIVLIFLILISCNKKLDMNNIESIANSTMNFISEKDSISLNQMIMKDAKDRSLNKLLREAGLISLKENLYNYKEIINLKYEVSNEMEDNRINFYYLADSNYMKFYLSFQKLNSRYIIKNCWSENLTKECNEYKKMSFEEKYGNFIYSKSVNWSLNRGYNFKDFNLRIVNDKFFKINVIKFRLNLFDKDGKEVFRRIITREIEFNKGDMIDVPINELNNYYLGFKPTKDSFTYQFEIISVYPEPKENNKYCNKINEL